MESPKQVVSTPIDEFQRLPEKPGVYILKNSEGRPVYVGKASSIKSRVLAHLHPKYDDPIALILRDQIKSADYIATQTPIEALILENVLIKRHRPRYNIRLKDDKSYPYIRVTLSEPYPRVEVTRRIPEEDDGARYYGPYANVRAAKRTVKYLRRLFQIRGCTLPLDGVKKFKACIDHSIGLCKAPCIFAISKADYDSDVKKFQMYLEGKLVQLSKEMYKDMWSASEKEDFELAAKIRNDIRSLETTALKQRIVFTDGRRKDVEKRDKDVVTIARGAAIAAAVVLQVRDDVVVGRDKFILDGINPNISDSEIISAFLKQRYGSSRAGEDTPHEIVVPNKLEEEEDICMLLAAASHDSELGSFKISTASDGAQNKKLLKLAQENAILAFKEEESKDEVRRRERLRSLKDLKEVLELSKIPKRIECYDISNIRGKEAVGAMTVFVDGFPEKSQYRKFKIKTVDQIDDYSMMAEMVSRRLRKLSDYGSAKKKFADNPPDLIVIDGGRGHLNAVLAQMRKEGIFGIPTISIAKEEELLFLPRRIAPLRLDRDSEALHVIQHIRDEAHRFGITYHRKLRGRGVTSSVLDAIPGIGEKRKRNLLAHFGSIDALKRSSQDEVAQVASVNQKLARTIVESLNSA